MNAAIQIRSMTPEDVSPVMELASKLEHVPRWPLSSWTCVAQSAHIALVAADPAGILGFAVAGLIPSNAELETIAVAPARRRRGIARLLLVELIRKLRPAGVKEIWLEVRVSNEPAIRLYRALGFEETGRRPSYYSDPVEDALMMQLPLL